MKSIIYNRTVEILETSKYMVGYVDLLGFKKSIAKDVDNKLLNTVYQCYVMAMTGSNMMSAIDKSSYKVKIFSDNIIIAIPCDPNASDDTNPIIVFNRIVALMGMLQRIFLEKGIFVRGGITYGELFIDDVMVWGEALLEAYNLENSEAKYPRIIISERMKGIAVETYGNVHEMFYINNIRTDSDGKYFLDYLNYPLDGTVNKALVDSLDNVNNLITSEKDEKILEKLKWHKEYVEALIAPRS